MKTRILSGLILFVLPLSILMVEPGRTRGSQPHAYLAPVGANASPAAAARWFVDTVDSTTDVGQYASIAFHPTSGLPYVSYYDATYHDLWMAKYVGSYGNCGPDNDWACERVDGTGDVGQYSSIAVDPTDGYPIIAYYDLTNGALKLAIGSAVGWLYKTVDEPLLDSAGAYASLALDSTGKTHIAYYFSSQLGADSLWYARYVGGGGNCGGNDYQCNFIDGGDRVGKYASLALDSADRPRIAYYDEGNNTLMYAFHDGVSWTIREILPTSSGQYASLYVDRDNGDLAHIAHYDSTNGNLGYAVYVGSGGNCGFDGSSTTFQWQCDEIESVGTSTHPKGVALAVDGASYPIIAYQSGGAECLKVARPAAALGLLIGNCGPGSPFYTWQCEVISIGLTTRQGDFVSLATNSAGLSTIAYYGNISSTDGDLKVAYQRLQVFLPLALRDH